MSETHYITLRVCITGRVQGVCYRAWTEEQATALGLNGWVRNHHDGSVEAIFSGLERRVEDMITACYQGPPSARVDGVERHAFSEEVAPGFHTMPTV